MDCANIFFDKVENIWFKIAKTLWLFGIKVKTRKRINESFVEKIINKQKTRSKLKYYSQYGQDCIALYYSKQKKKGFFVDIGANDGICISNSKVFEELGWEGICVEPDPDVFARLSQNRVKSDNYQLGISDKSGYFNFTKISGKVQLLSGLSDEFEDAHKERIAREAKEHCCKIETITIQTKRFEELMSGYPNIKVIDYLSIDTEGNESKILRDIDFKKYDIKILSVENNYEDNGIVEYMAKKGYKSFKCGCDDIYVKKKLYNRLTNI